MNPHDRSLHQSARTAWDSSESERLYRQRLRDVLGVNAAGVEVIVRLRNQMIALQTRMRQLEHELTVWEVTQDTRLRHHRETCFEASWQELADPEKRL